MFKPVIIDPKTATIYHLVKPRSDATLCRMSALTYSSRHGRVQGNVIFSTGSLPLCRICQKVLTRIENEKLGKKRLKEHLVQPYEEAEFYPVMLYRGATPLGRVKAIYNYFTAAMEMELSTDVPTHGKKTRCLIFTMERITTLEASWGNGVGNDSKGSTIMLPWSRLSKR
jgi:hypothetical protein